MTEQSSSEHEDLHELTVEDDFAGEGGAGAPENTSQGASGSGDPEKTMPGYGSDSGFDTETTDGSTGVVGGPTDAAGGEVGGGGPGAANSEYSEDSASEENS